MVFHMPEEAGIKERSSTWLELVINTKERKSGFQLILPSAHVLARSEPPYAEFKLIGSKFSLEDGDHIIEQLAAFLEALKNR